MGYIKRLVSIIIPTYNRKELLVSAVESCINQLYSEIEIIIVDNGSTDNTGKYITSKVNDERIRFFRLERKGVSYARNFGLSKARGEYIQFLDSDDLLYPEKIQIQIEFLNKNLEYVATYCNWNYIQLSTMKHLKYNGFNKDENIRRYIVSGNRFPINSVLLRINDIIFDENLIIGEDWDYWFRLLHNKRIKYLNFFGCSVGIHDNNTSLLDLKKNVQNDLIVLDKIAQVDKSLVYIVEFEKFKRLFYIKDKACINSLRICLNNNFIQYTYRLFTFLSTRGFQKIKNILFKR